MHLMHASTSLEDLLALEAEASFDSNAPVSLLCVPDHEMALALTCNGMAQPTTITKHPEYIICLRFVSEEPPVFLHVEQAMLVALSTHMCASMPGSGVQPW